MAEPERSPVPNLGESFKGAAENFADIPCKAPPISNPKSPTAEDIFEQLRERPPCPPPAGPGGRR